MDWKDLGKVTLPDTIKVARLPFALGFAVLLIGVLFALEKLTIR